MKLLALILGMIVALIALMASCRSIYAERPNGSGHWVKLHVWEE